MGGSQYQKYVDDLAKTTCAAEQRRLLADGPPVNIYEPHGMPCVCGTCEGRLEVAALWYASKGDVSPQLEGALTGKARMAFWEEQKKFRIQDEDDAGRRSRRREPKTTPKAELRVVGSE